MEGPHWVFMVCPGPAITDKVVHQTWSRKATESVDSETSSDHDDRIDNVHWSQLWSLYFSDRRALSSAFK